MNFEKNVSACILGRQIYDLGNKNGMVGCNYGGRYATGEGEGQGTSVGVICGYTNVWCRLQNKMYVAQK